MIDLNKIEATAKSATPGDWRFELSDGVRKPYVVRGREGGFAVAGLSRTQEDSDATHIATANPATVLEMVSMIRERDAVLRQALEALQADKYEMVEDADRNMVFATDAAIAAIKEILNEPTKP
jgi:hypothetical protein